MSLDEAYYNVDLPLKGDSEATIVIGIAKTSLTMAFMIGYLIPPSYYIKFTSPWQHGLFQISFKFYLTRSRGVVVKKKDNHYKT